jgi:quinol monooxygenase YgiN
MPFIQIVEFSTSRFEDMKALSDKYQADTQGRRTSARAMVCANRDQPGRYAVIAEFPSYEAAMENSELPETQELAKAMGDLADGPPTYTNLDVVDVIEGS